MPWFFVKLCKEYQTLRFYLVSLISVPVFFPLKLLLKINTPGFFRPCSSQKILQNFSYFPSHQIFRHMHEVLNIDKNKN